MAATFFQGAIPDSHTKIQSDSMNLEFSKILKILNSSNHSEFLCVNQEWPPEKKLLPCVFTKMHKLSNNFFEFRKFKILQIDQTFN